MSSDHIYSGNLVGVRPRIETIDRGHRSRVSTNFEFNFDHGADGFAFIAVGMHEFAAELEVHPKAERVWFFERGCVCVFLQRRTGMDSSKGRFQ